MNDLTATVVVQDLPVAATDLSGVAMSPAGRTVDQFAEDIGVPGMASGLFDHVHERPTDTGSGSFRPWSRDGCGKICASVENCVGALDRLAIATDDIVHAFFR